jgi:dinuclear metal center YbgI/SA1388 family protein
MLMVTAHEVMSLVHSVYTRELAESWDSVGFISGDWHSPVARILVTIDHSEDVLNEAIAINADLIISHHPLFLPRHSIVTEPYKTRLALRAIANGIALANAHTNADHANPGVSDYLAQRIGIMQSDPIIATFDGAKTGTGRIGNLDQPLKLADFADFVRAAIPRSKPRFSGDPNLMVSRVAVCGGAGDSLLTVVRNTNADVYVTSDLRHHPVAEHRDAGGCALIDIEHSAAEATWLEPFTQILAERLGLEVHVSTTNTSAWNS